MKQNNYYAGLTYKSNNLLARFSHRKRLLVGIELVLASKINSVLDYGCGDGKFLIDLSKIENTLKLYGYDPESTFNVSEKVSFYNNWSQLERLKVDCVTCFEVLEHFNKENQALILEKCKSKLKSSGILIISIPIEVGFSSLIKNIRRKITHKNPVYSIKNIIKSLFKMGIPEIRNQEGYIYTHLGFNYNELELLLLKHFSIVHKSYSPFKWLNVNFNSQLFYVLKVKEY